MKFLLLIAVIGIALWLFKTRSRSSGASGSPAAPAKPEAKKPGTPTAMLACAHCGVHLPQTDTVADAAGRPFCTEAHRLAGPR